MIHRKLPTRQELLPVFAVFVFFGFSWALYRLFWYVPSWLEYLNIAKVLTIAAYVLAFALIESLALTPGAAGFLALLPRTLLQRQIYPAWAASLAALISLAAVLLQRKINLVYRLELWQLVVYPLAFLLLLIVAVLVFSYLFERLALPGPPGLGDR